MIIDLWLATRSIKLPTTISYIQWPDVPVPYSYLFENKVLVVWRFFIASSPFLMKAKKWVPNLYILPHYWFFFDVLMLLDIGKEVEVCKENKECNCICTHRLRTKNKDRLAYWERQRERYIGWKRNRRTRGTILGYPQSKKRGRRAWKKTQTNWTICSLVRYLGKKVVTKLFCHVEWQLYKVAV